MGEQLLHGPKVFLPEAQEGFPLRGFLLAFEDIFYDRQGKKIAVLKFLNQTNALHIAIIIIRNISSPFAGLGEEAFADVIMDGFFGDAGSLNQLTDFQRKTPGREEEPNISRFLQKLFSPVSSRVLQEARSRAKRTRNLPDAR
jgi:hypothetical protein